MGKNKGGELISGSVSARLCLVAIAAAFSLLPNCRIPVGVVGGVALCRDFRRPLLKSGLESVPFNFDPGFSEPLAFIFSST